MKKYNLAGEQHAALELRINSDVVAVWPRLSSAVKQVDPGAKGSRHWLVRIIFWVTGGQINKELYEIIEPKLDSACHFVLMPSS